MESLVIRRAFWTRLPHRKQVSSDSTNSKVLPAHGAALKNVALWTTRIAAGLQNTSIDIN